MAGKVKHSSICLSNGSARIIHGIPPAQHKKMTFDALLITSWFTNNVLFWLRRAAQSTNVEASMRGANEEALQMPSINSGIGK